MLPRNIFTVILVFSLIHGKPILAGKKYTAAFLNIGAGARAAGMGSSFSALGLDATTIHWNPAAMGRLTQPEIVLMHSAQFNNLLKYDTGHFVLPNIVSGSFGIGYIRLATGDIFFTENLGYYDWGQDNLPGTGDPGEGDGKHNPGERIIFDEGRLKIVNDAEQALFLSYARQITPRLAIGGNLKYLWQSVGQYSSSGWGFDFGAIYDLTPRLTLALSLQDVFGTMVRWSTGHTDTRTINVKPGFAYRIDLPSLASQVNLASDVDIRFDNIKENCDFHAGPASFDLHLGLEYWLYQMIALRLGSEQQSFTAGAGIKISFFEIDYAFSGFDLGNTHRISLTLHRPTFGKKTPKPPKTKQVPIIEKEKPGQPEQEKQPPKIPVEEKKPIETEKLPEAQKQPSIVEYLSITEPKLVGSINFETGRTDLRPSSIQSLKAIAIELRKYPHHKIKIVGHTDNRRIHTSQFPDNQMLSEARANVVKNFLVKNEGFEAERIINLGLGANLPVASNESDAGRSLNRRVEVFITVEQY